MHPLLFSVGNLHIYWLSVSIVLSWMVFSFLFWKSLRRIGISEDTTFDLTFYATIISVVVARAFFIGSHSELFAGKSILLWFALWVVPGLSWTGALIGALATFVSLARYYKVRLGQVLDAFSDALPFAFILGLVGSFFDGAQVGKISTLPWAVSLYEVEGLRHPVEAYAFISIIILMAIARYLYVVASRHSWAYGIVGIWFILYYSCFMFLVEFAKDSRVYFGNITANQWVYIALVAECVGVLYVRGGGREKVRPLFHLAKENYKSVKEKIYAAISKRRFRNH